METARRFPRGSRRRHAGTPPLGQLLTAAVESASAEVAIRYNPTGAPGDQLELTYRELDERSSQVARELIERGLGPGDVVAIGMARSPEAVLAVWAVAKTGAAHVIIDPADPADRIALVAGDSGAAFGLTTSKYRRVLGRSLYWIELDDPVQSDRIARRPRHPISYADRIRKLDERHPAYICYRDDPTGKPLGVVVPHAGLGAAVAAVTDIYGIASDSRVVHSCPLTVDTAVLELLLTCTAGATLVIAPAGVSGGRELGDLLHRERVTHLITTAEVADSLDPAGPADLTLVAVVGDRSGSPGRWAGTQCFVTSYGCAEAGIVATNTRPAAPGEPDTLGPAVDGAEMLVLDARLRPVPAGEVGELYLAGPVLTQSYLNRPALSAVRFVAVPGSHGRPGARMYRTGAAVRRIDTPRGPEIEFPGAGTRPLPRTAEFGAAVEPARPAAVSGREIRPMGSVSGQEIRPAGPVSGQEIRPTGAVSGWAERPAAPVPLPPPDPEVVEVVAEVAQIPPIAEPHSENFYGPDLPATPDPLVSARAVDPVTDTDTPLIQVSEAELEAWRAVHPRLEEVLPLGPFGTGLYFRSLLAADDAEDDALLFALELGGVVDLDRLHSAAQGLVDRHPALRSVFTTGADGTPVQLVVETAEVPWQVVDDVGDYEMAGLLTAEHRTTFAVDSAPPLRFTIYRTVSGRTHCVLVAHPLLFDTGSAGVLLRDLLTLYALRGDGAALPAPPSYREYLRWRAHGDAEAARAHWAELLSGARPTELAAVLAPPEEPDSGCAESVHVLGEEEAAAMAAYAVSAGVTVETVVRALWALVLASLTGSTDIVFGAVVPGRPPEPGGTDRMAGILTETIPVRIRLEPRWTVRDLLTRIRSEQAAALARHYLDPAGIAPEAAQLFDTVLAFDPDPADAARLAAAAGALDGLEVVDVTTRIGSLHPVTLAVESADRLLLRLRYRRDRVAEHCAQAVSGLLLALVGQLLAVPAQVSLPPAGWWQAPTTLGELGELPADRPRPAGASRRRGVLRRDVGDALHGALNSAAEQWDTNEFTLVQAALAVLLARLSGYRETVVGAFATKGSAGGLSVLHTDVNPADGFDALLVEAREAGAAALGTTGRGRERVGHLVDTLRTVAGRPPFRVLLSTDSKPAELPGNLDLRIDLVADSAGATLTFTYARDLFDAPTIGDHADRLLRILTAVAADPGVAVGDIDLYFPGERELVLREWNSAGVAVPPVTLVDLIEARAGLDPAAPAVRAGETVLRFDDLLTRAYRVARRLIEAGAGPETLVAVAVPRTEELPVALLGVLVAGAAYLPVDPARPWSRQLLSGTRPVMVLTTAALRETMAVDLPVVVLEETGHHTAHPVTDADRRAALRPDNLVYAAPSTGPAGCAGMTHRNVVELFANTQLLFDFDDADVWALFHPLTSDFSVWELWCALAGGGCVVVVDETTAESPERFRELLVREQVTVIAQTPSAFDRFAEADRIAHDAGDSTPSALRYVVLGGAALDLRRLRQWYERHGASSGGEGNAPWVVNMYGTTETTVHATYLPLDEHLVDNPASVIGRALPGLDALVLDDRLRPTPVGVPGEIYVAGAQLTRGYLDRPGLTATRFVADPFGAPGSRMYRSGDFGRWAGFAGRANLEYTGRRDIPRQTPGSAIESEAPAADRAPYTEPAGPTETVVAEVFADLLETDRIGAADDFFALGGNSLLASRAVARINDALGADLTVRAVFEAPVVSELAARVIPGAGRAAPRPVLDRADRPERIPLAPNQHGIWLGAREDPGAHNIVLALELTGALDTSALRYAVSDVLERHEPLRTRYPADSDGLPYQEILPVAQVLRGGLEIAETDDVAGRIAELRTTVFDITSAAPIRGLLLATGPDEHVLAVVAHRIAADGSSPAPFMRDLLTAYLARVGGESPRWSPLPVQYADYALWQHALLGTDDDANSVAARQSGYWRKQLRGADPGGELPPDRQRPDTIVLPDATTEFVLPAPVHRALDALADERGATVFLILHAAVNTLLHRLTGAGTVAVGRRLTGRDEPALGDLVGRFVNTIVLRTRVRATQTFTELLDRTRETDAGAFANADIPFEQVAAAVAPAQEPLFGVLLSPCDEPAAAKLPGLAVRGVDHGISDVETDLRIDMDPRRDSAGYPGELRIVLAYRTDLFDEETVQSFGDGLTRILTAVATEPRIRVGEFDIAGESAEVDEDPAPGTGESEQVPATGPDQVPAGGPDDDAVDIVSATESVGAEEISGGGAADPLRIAPVGNGTAAGAENVVDRPAPRSFRAPAAVPAGTVAATVVPRSAPATESVLPVDTAGPVVAAGPIVTAATAGIALARALAVSVEDDPDAPAVVRGDEAMTYQELDARSSRLARVLIDRGCGPRTGVVTALPRDMDAVVATWAVLKAGAALVPADAVSVAATAGLTVEFGLAVGSAPRQPDIPWLLLDDPAVRAATGRQSPRPVTHAHRVRSLRGSDLVVVDATGRQVTYDGLAAAVAGIHTATDLTYEAATYGHGRGDGPAAVTEIVAAGAAGATVVLLPGTGISAAEWITHLWSDAAGLAVLDPGSLGDLTALLLADGGRPGPAWAEVPCVVGLPTLFG